MVEALKICAAVLAAGSSKRFGDADKLSAILHEKMLGQHICDTLSRLAFAHCTVITAAANHPCQVGWEEAGFKILVNEQAFAGMGTSVALAAKNAMDMNADGLMICLADMPFIPEAHLSQLLQYFSSNGATNIIASNNGNATSPPAIFPRESFDFLVQLDGDMGAKKLLHEAICIPLEPSKIIDVDTVEMLEKLMR